MYSDHGAFNTALKAAVGDNAALIAELRRCFVHSANLQISLLSRCPSEGNWEHICWRLRGLAASFGANDVLALAKEAANNGPGDEAILDKLKNAINTIEGVDTR